jgi:hypothetical protein
MGSVLVLSLGALMAECSEPMVLSVSMLGLDGGI